MIESAVRKAYVFMTNGIEPDGSNRKIVVDGQFCHLMGAFKKLGTDTDDCNKAIVALKDESAFDESQKKALRACLVERVASLQNSHGCGLKTTTTQKTQVHNYLHNYGTQTHWDKWCDPRVNDLNLKMEAMTDLMHQIGCDHPKETPTQIGAAAIVLAAHNRPFTDKDAYKLVVELRRQMEAKRSSKSVGAVVLDRYQEDVKDYVQIAPHAYKSTDPPIECPISTDAIASALRRVSSRDTNKMVRDTVPRRHTSKSVDPCGAVPHVGATFQEGYAHGYRDGAAAADRRSQFDAHTEILPSKHRRLMGPAASNASMFADTFDMSASKSQEPPVPLPDNGNVGEKENADDGIDAMLQGLKGGASRRSRGE